MSDAPKPQPGIMEITLYQAGASHLPGDGPVLKLSSNENPFGPGEAARAAYRAAAEHLELYPSSDHAGLRAAIAQNLDVPATQVICGAGSDELLNLIAQAYAGPGDEVIHTAHGFLMYMIAARTAGATPIEVPELARRVDVDQILAALTPRTRIVYVTNPGNPTGTLLKTSEIERLVDALPRTVLLVLDGAYAEYVTDTDYDAGRALALSRPNVVMTRTFSKIHGLGGLRVGYAVAAQQIIDVLNRMRGPFNLSAPALAAAEAAMRDRDHVAYCRAQNSDNGAWLRAGLMALGLEVDPSSANYLLVRFKEQTAAEAAEARLRAARILVRKTAAYKLPGCLRITIGDRAACARVLEAIGAGL